MTTEQGELPFFPFVSCSAETLPGADAGVAQRVRSRLLLDRFGLRFLSCCLIGSLARAVRSANAARFAPGVSGPAFPSNRELLWGGGALAGYKPPPADAHQRLRSALF